MPQSPNVLDSRIIDSHTTPTIRDIVLEVVCGWMMPVCREATQAWESCCHKAPPPDPVPHILHASFHDVCHDPLDPQATATPPPTNPYPSPRPSERLVEDVAEKIGPDNVPRQQLIEVEGLYVLFEKRT